MLQNQSDQLPSNFHFVGASCNQAIFNRSPSVPATGPPMSHPNANVNADNGGAARTDKRIIWSVDEDSRLVSLVLLKHYLFSICSTVIADECMVEMFPGPGTRK